MPAKGDKKQIKLNGQKVEAEYIGKGQFSTCYRIGNKVYSFTKNDPSKELINLFCDDNIHLPALHLFESYNDYTQVYDMPFYDKLTKDSEPAWSQYKTLKSLWEGIPTLWKAPQDWHKEKVQKFQDLVNASGLPESLKDAINQLCSNSYNYDRILFEFSLRNLATDEQDNLILLDVIFKAPK